MLPTKRNTAKEAIGRWPGILEQLGVSHQYLRNKHGPCPACGGKDRFRFDDRNGRGAWICSRCGSGDGFDLLKLIYGWDYAHAAKAIDRIISTVPHRTITQGRSEDSKMRIVHEVWKQGQPIVKNDPVWRYLNRRLGINTMPPDVRYHPALRHVDGGMHPVMLTLMRYPDGAVASIHRTYLTDQGDKADVSEVRMFMPGRPLKTASMQLGRLERCLGIAEGIETALAASKRFGLPVWAAGNARLLESWMPPAEVHEVLIAADNDHSYTGQAAAHSLAKRLRRQGYIVEVQIPERAGTDWADILQEPIVEPQLVPDRISLMELAQDEKR